MKWWPRRIRLMVWFGEVSFTSSDVGLTFSERYGDTPARKIGSFYLCWVPYANKTIKWRVGFGVGVHRSVAVIWEPGHVFIPKVFV